MLVDEKKWDDLSNYRDSLEHHGVQGMKWGVRKDRQHLSNIGSKKASSPKQSWKDRRAKQKKEDEKKKAALDKAKKEQRRRDILNDPKKLYKHRKEYSYDEIKKAIEQFKWERELKGYSESTLKKGADFAKDIVSLMSNSINVYNQAARIVNSLYEGNNGKNKLPFIANNISDEKNKKKK